MYTAYEPDSITEPKCCDDPMVRNSVGRYECATAFFALIDEGIVEGLLDGLTADDVPAHLATTLTHWRESWVSDELVWCAGVRAGLDYHQIGEPSDRGAVLIDCGRLVQWVADGEVVRRGWFGLRTGQARLKPCKRCWPDGDPAALSAATVIRKDF